MNWQILILSLCSMALGFVSGIITAFAYISYRTYTRYSEFIKKEYEQEQSVTNAFFTGGPQA